MLRFLNNFEVTVRHTNAYAVRQLAPLDIGHSELAILLYLFKFKKANQDMVSKHYKIDKGSIAKTLKKLEEKGYIEREINENNQREKIISLTEKGETLYPQIESIHNECTDRLLKGISEEELKVLEEISTKILKNSIELVRERG